MTNQDKDLEFERGHKRISRKNSDDKKPSRNTGNSANRRNNNNRPKRSGGPTKQHSRALSGAARSKNYVERKVGRRMAPRPTGLAAMPKRPKKDVPAIEGDAVRVITLGGVEEVGRNMFAVEYKDNIWIFDIGFQFLSEGDAPGIDYSLPNIEYLEKYRHKIRGVIITHGHLDHIGGIPFLMDRLGNPPIYTRNLTAIMIKKRMHEFPNAKPIKFVIVEPEDVMMIGELEFYFFGVTHSIPDCIGTSIRTPHGNVIITGDIKLEHEDGVPVPGEIKHWEKVTQENNLVMLSDSTNCENPGWSIPEPHIHDTVEDLIREANGRVIIATFASQFRRMIAFMKAAEKMGKKVALEGRSIKTNLEIAKISGKFTPQPGTIININDVDKYPVDQVLILCTGGQGEQFAALPRMARNEHKSVKLNERDTVILSSSVIPGNEISVRNLMDQLARNDVRLIHYKTSDVHSTGHGNQEELKWIINTVKAKYFVPAYGYHSMTKRHAQLAYETGMDKDHVFVMDNGSILEFTGPDEAKLLAEKAPSHPILVDGFSISAMQHTVIADRQMLSKEGFINVVVLIDVKSKSMKKSPDVISRGFVYLRDSQDLLSQTRSTIRRIVDTELKKTNGNRVDVDNLKRELHKHLERLMIRKTNKRPIIIPVVLVV